MQSPVAAPPDTDAQTTAARVEQVTALFTGMIQALRAQQLYGPSNLTTQRAVDSLRAGFERVWKLGPELEIEVHPDALVLEGRPVCQSPSQGESIAFLMFRDGIRSLSFRQGFEEEELSRFLALLHRARYQPSESDDLVTLLWDEDSSTCGMATSTWTLRRRMRKKPNQPCKAVTAAASPTRTLALQIHDANTRALANAGLDAGEYPGSADPPALPRAAGAMHRHTLQLDPEAFVYLQRELEEEMRRDLRQDVVNALLDSLEVPDTRAQVEILQIFAVVIPQLLSERHLRLVTGILGVLLNSPSSASKKSLTI